MGLKNRQLHSNLKRKISTDRRFLFFSSFEFLYFSVMTCSSFFVLFLYNHGFTNTQVGIALAVNSGAAFVALPIWGIVADKIGSKRKTLMLLFSGALIASLCTGLIAGSVLATIFFMGIMVSFRGSLSSIVDSWIIYNVNMPDIEGRRFSYGNIRMFGSIGFFTSGILFYFIFNLLKIDVKYAFVGSALFAGACFLFLLLHKNEYSAINSPHAAKLKLSELQPGRLFKNYYYITFVAVYMLINVPGYFGLSYITNLLKAVGSAPVFVGAAGSIRVLCEVPMLFFSKKLIQKAGYRKIIFLVGGLLICEQLMYVFSSRVWHVMAAQVLEGSINGLLMSSSVAYIFSLVPSELSATAQTICAASCFTASIAGNLLSGWVLDTFGIRMLYLICGVSAALGIALFGASLFIGRLAKLKYYDAEIDGFSKAILARMSGEAAK